MSRLIPARDSFQLAAACSIVVLSSTFASTAPAIANNSLTVCVKGSEKKLSSDGACDPGYTAQLYSLVAVKSKPRAVVGAPAPSPPNPIVEAVTAGPAALIAKAANQGCQQGWNAHLTIGDSFNDLNFLSTKDCNAGAAKGAQFSWARDGVTFNDQWTAKGAVAERFVWLNQPPGPGAPTGPYLNLLSVAPVFTFQRVTNSNLTLASKNVDTLAYGFSSEALFDRVAKYWQVYLRARATVNGDFEGNTHSWSTTAEVQPLTLAIEKIVIPSVGYITFLPLIRTQYFERVGPANPTTYKNDPIFNGSGTVLRSGPVISATLIPQSLVNTDPDKPPPPPQWSFNLLYSWYYDFFSGQKFEHLNPSFTYNFTDNIGLTLSYEKGRIEQTGNKIDLVSLGLSVKN
jgi:hypothetical protein